MDTCFGFDLGTSNCALAVAGEENLPEIHPVTQVLSANGVGEKPLLPSAVYIPAEGEQADGAKYVIGTFARERGALQPDRLISSAKSWLCNPHADRRGAILPWGSATVDSKWSPLEVSRRLIEHVLTSFRNAQPGTAMNPANVVITVPASFDEAARALTLEAAQQAGLPEVTLLEEPQAACYAWLEQQGANWRTQARPGDLILVCDVGGGTADFSLIAVSEQNGSLGLERIAVGEHLLLGGDNMDLALAHTVAERLAEQGTTLDDWQFLALVQAASAAKEALLADDSLTEAPMAIPSRGRSLVASTIRTTLTREQVQAVVVDGFFPMTAADEMPAIRRGGGLRESGLPYAADAAISRHLARFLTRAHANAASSPHLLVTAGGELRLGRSSLLLPDAVLFNGGVFKAPALRNRILQLLTAWAGQNVRELEGAQPDHAVALGAAIYARLRATGKGIRIKSGTARSYYIGMESSAMAVPGRRPAVKALCVAAQGMEEGSRHEITGQEFFLYTGEASEFRFFSSEVRSGDAPGQVLPDVSELEETARLEIALPPPEGHQPGEEVPVRMETVVTELGNLELYMVHASGGRWKLELNVRMQ